jgi:hypothetical protein
MSYIFMGIGVIWLSVLGIVVFINKSLTFEDISWKEAFRQSIGPMLLMGLFIGAICFAATLIEHGMKMKGY